MVAHIGVLSTRQLGNIWQRRYDESLQAINFSCFVDDILKLLRFLCFSPLVARLSRLWFIPVLGVVIDAPKVTDCKYSVGALESIG